MTWLPGVATVQGALCNLLSLVKDQGPDHARLLLGHEENKVLKIFEKTPFRNVKNTLISWSGNFQKILNIER